MAGKSISSLNSDEDLGLGAAIAREFHAAGYNVGIGDIDADGAVASAHELDASGATATGIALDVRDQAAFEAAHGSLAARWGSVEASVNNAASTVARPVLDITPDEFDAVLAVNSRGTFVGSQVFARAFKAAGYGRIVNLASSAGQNGGTATGAHYAVSKGGIITMTKVFARDLAPFGITVNAIAPGPLDTPMVHRTVPADRMAQFLTNVPVGQIGDPAFIASMAVRSCARDATFITGATIDIN
ncbi:hypothetical protein OY671_008262, partial [Metschnikowia pulcherrima]